MCGDDCLTMENVFEKETENPCMWLACHGFEKDPTKKNWRIRKTPERLSFLKNLRLGVKRNVDAMWSAEVFYDRGSDDESAFPKYSTADYKKPQDALSVIIDYLEQVRRNKLYFGKKCKKTLEALFPFHPVELDAKEQWLLDHGFGRSPHGPIWKRVFAFDEKEVTWKVQKFNDSNWTAKRESPKEDGGDLEVFGDPAGNPYDAIFHLVEKLHRESVDLPELDQMKKE